MTSLLELDSDLGQLLEGERRAAAEAELVVRVHRLPVGEWDAARLAGASAQHVGLLVLDGMLAREVLMADTVSTELLGPGDVVRPWGLQEPVHLLQLDVRWSVLSASRVALLDRRIAAQLTRYPEINAVLLDRVNERAVRLATTQAISQLNRVERRLLAFFWHLAERWGRMSSDGVVVPLTLSHRMLGQLVGARRPTVSSALGTLADSGELVRRPDGTWLLTGEPIGVPAGSIQRLVPLRRRLLPEQQHEQLEAPPTTTDPGEAAVLVTASTGATHADLTARLEVVRGDWQQRMEQLHEAVGATQELCRRAAELRDARVKARAARNGGRRQVVGA
jgi:hypothetical protein